MINRIAVFNQYLLDISHLLASSPELFYLTVILLSLTVGSFLNVVVYRLPKMLEQGWYAECREFLADELTKVPAKKITPLTLSKPCSTCPNCNHKIRFYENIPLISWLVLRGKCIGCKTAISARYPLVELATAILSVVVANHFGVSAQTFWALILTSPLVILEHR